MEKLAVIPPATPPAGAQVMQVKTMTPEVRLCCEESGEQIVPAGMALLPVPLRINDRVLVQPTPQGWIITALLAGQQRPPVALDDNGQLLLQCDQGVRLQVGEAHIEITAAGCITVDGKEVHTLARGLQRILGATVQIN